jgi:DNA polymerase-4
MDSFYVSVERLKNPKLCGKPMAVGGTGRRSVLSSASYEARKFGVRSAMPTAQALRLCPKLIIVEPDFTSYSKISKDIFSELTTLAPVVEQASIDEAYLDFTGCERLYSSREASGVAIRKLIKEKFLLTASVGLSINKLVSKVASDHCKPDGLLVVVSGDEEKFFSTLAIKKIPGVGFKSNLILERAGIITCGELVARKPSWLKDHIGDYAVNLLEAARGIDYSEVSTEGERKSIGAEETFTYDISNIEELRNILRRMSEEIASSLREEFFEARTIQLKMRLPDFTTLTRAKTLKQPTILTREIFETAFDLLTRYKPSGVALRLIGVSVRNLIGGESTIQARQLGFFEDPLKREKEEKIETVKDLLRKRFGADIIKT